MIEPQKVFENFLNLCTDHAGHLQYHLAKNAVLEWFGRTIRGREKIKNFIRYELSQEYEHQFCNWKVVDSFEVRPSHFETKTLSLDASPERSCNTQTDDINNTTPKQSKIKIVELPALHRGHRFLPEPDSDDEEFKDLGLSKLIDLSPPSSPTRNNFPSSALEEPPFKKLRMTRFKNFFCASREKNVFDDQEGSSAIECNNSDINLNSDKVGCSVGHINTILSSPDSKYSDLYYIEAAGSLMTLNRLKYPGVQQSNVGGMDFESQSDKNSEHEITTYSYNTSGNSYSEREVKLKISYRICLEDSRIEFALIIYEHSVRRASTRRNLLSEFKDVSSDLEEKKSILINKTKSEKKNRNVKMKRKTPLKRLMRLF